MTTVLPRITPNVGLQPQREEAPLAAYLGSLRRVAVFVNAEALPAHEYRFDGLAASRGVRRGMLEPCPQARLAQPVPPAAM